MAVTVVFGMTESGKSYYVENKIISNHKKVIIFDLAKCFSAQNTFLLGPTVEQENAVLDRVFDLIAHNPPKFRVALRTTSKTDDRKAFDKLASMLTILGPEIGNDKERTLLVVDEADFICSDKFQSARLKHIVNKGRHDFIDSLFIARIPQRLHGDIKSNASTVICFQIPNAPEIDFFVKNFGKKNAENIKKLKKYHHFIWKNTGEMRFFDEKGRITKEYDS